MTPRPPPPVLALGFRPFFLLAGVFAAVWLPIWLLTLHGAWTLHGALQGPAWHAHEMLFGFVAAVIAGFLLTAVRNWTSQPTPTGAPLAGLAGLWLLARLLNLWGGALPQPLVIAVDVAFLPAVALALAGPILRAKNMRNVAFPVLLLLLGFVNLMSHLGVTLGTTADQLALDIVLVIVVLITGRVVPMFTQNALGQETTKRPTLDKALLACLVGVLIFDRVPQAEAGRGLLSFVAGALLVVRMVGWHSWKTWKLPILWVLHLGHAWLALGLLLRGVAIFAPSTVPASTATHALTVGAVGTLILGMMARVSLGHTGRKLEVSKPVAAAFGLLALAALVRAVVPMLDPAWLLLGWTIAGVLWTAAFAVFVGVYAPILLAPRVDGKAG